MQQQSDGMSQPEPPRLGAESGLGPHRFLPLHRFEKSHISRSSRPVAAGDLRSLVHDARNMVASIDLYCDLLDEPDVVAPPYRHYSRELRLVAETSRRLLEKLAIFSEAAFPMPMSASSGAEPLADLSLVKGVGAVRQSVVPPPHGKDAYHDSQSIPNLAEELIRTRSLLSAMAGRAVTVGLSLTGGHRCVGICGDDLTRVLVNLTCNAAEAMPEGGHIQISLEEQPDRLLLTFADSGPGIPAHALKAIFTPGYTTHINLGFADWEPHLVRQPPTSFIHSTPTRHRGLGLAIVRSLVSAAGGSVHAENLPASASPSTSTVNEAHPTSAGTKSSGACFVLEFPILPSQESLPQL